MLLTLAHVKRYRYAYIEIALYGKPYIAAAKDTWRMFKDRGTLYLDIREPFNI